MAGKRRARRGLLGAFRRDREGTTAIEFAIVAMPFLALIFAILEFGLAFFVNRVLDNAVFESARLIKTGQAKQFSETQFKDAVCERLTDFLCNEDRLDIDVRAFSSFAAISLPELTDEDGNFNDNSSYTASSGGQIVVVRVIYRWPMFTSLLQTSAGDTGNMERLLTSAAVFRNEPFP